jgi:DNA-binding MarR family transcriptional regulator
MQTSVSAVNEDAVRALMLASRAFVGLTARSLAGIDGDVTLPQFRALVVLAVRGPQRSIDIAEELRVNPSTGTRMCDRLVRKGLVRRTRSSSDRRVVRLRLTKAGHDIVEQVMGRRRAELERLVAATAELWKPAVTKALCAFAEAAGEPDEQDWWLGWAAHAAQANDDADGPDEAGALNDGTSP